MTHRPDQPLGSTNGKRERSVADRQMKLRCDVAQCDTLRAKLLEVGFVSLDHAIDQNLLGQMQAEVARQHSSALRAEGKAEVPYRARVAKLGDLAHDFLSSAETANFLLEVFGERLVLSQDASCYTYYCEGDRLGLHRDRQEVYSATLIVYLAVSGTITNHRRSGLMLHIFGKTKPQDDSPPAAVIPSRAGTLVVGWGGKIWHERPQLGRGESVAALTACYRRSTAVTEAS